VWTIADWSSSFAVIHYQLNWAWSAGFVDAVVVALVVVAAVGGVGVGAVAGWGAFVGVALVDVVVAAVVFGLDGTWPVAVGACWTAFVGLVRRHHYLSAVTAGGSLLASVVGFVRLLKKGIRLVKVKIYSVTF
jgi:hypothetical protein